MSSPCPPTRQFLGQMDKPDVDFIEGLSPAVSIDQKSTNRNPRSTVGTITEVYDYLRLLFARAGRPHCPVCGEPITRQTPQQIVDRLLELPERTRFQVLAPVVRARKGEFVDLFAELQARGFARARVDGAVVSLTEPPMLEKQVKHTIDVVVDRLVAKGGDRSAKQRLTDSVETAARSGWRHRRHRVRRCPLRARISRANVASANGWRVPTITPSRWTRSSRGPSPSTVRSVPARSAPGSGPSSRSTRSLSSPTRTSPGPGRGGALGGNQWGVGVLPESPHGACPGDVLLDGRAVALLPQRAKDAILSGRNHKVHVKYRNRYGRERSYSTGFEGRGAVRQAAACGDRLRLEPGTL